MRRSSRTEIHYLARHMGARTSPRVKIRVHCMCNMLFVNIVGDGNRVCEMVRANASSVDRHYMAGSACQAYAGFVRSCDFLRNAATSSCKLSILFVSHGKICRTRSDGG